MTARFKDYRQRRKRFDGDEMDAPRGFGGPPSGQRPAWSPQPPARSAAPMPSGPVLTGTVKWFNPEKGFGFVEMDDAEGDVFLHVAVLESSGRKSVAPGAKLECRVGAGTKGRQVTEVVSVDESEAQPDAGARRSPPRAGGFGAGGGFGGGAGAGGGGFGGGAPRAPRSTPDMSDAVEMSGKVKWYNAEKGFGFIEVGDGGRDVFVHATALMRSGLAALDQGQSVRIKVVQGQKGREAATVDSE